MRKPLFVMIALSAWSLGALTLVTRAHADSLSCQSVNGETRCVGSGGLDCRSVHGRMVCVPGAKGNCEIAQGTIFCRNGNVTQSFRAAPIPQQELDEPPDEDETPESPSGRGLPRLTNGPRL